MGQSGCCGVYVAPQTSVTLFYQAVREVEDGYGHGDKQVLNEPEDPDNDSLR
jgi:hypothetical protein